MGLRDYLHRIQAATEDARQAQDWLEASTSEEELAERNEAAWAAEFRRQRAWLGRN